MSLSAVLFSYTTYGRRQHLSDCDIVRFERTLKTVTSIQDTFCEYDIIKKVMPLLARQNQHLKKEVLALMDMMLFNANKAVQVGRLQSHSSFVTYF